MFVRGRDIGKEFAARTGTDNEGPVLKFAGIIEIKDGWGDEKLKGSEEYEGRGYMPERIGLELTNRDSVMSSHILVERGKRKA